MVRYDVQTEGSELFSGSQTPEQYDVSCDDRTKTEEVITEQPNSSRALPSSQYELFGSLSRQTSQYHRVKVTARSQQLLE